MRIEILKNNGRRQIMKEKVNVTGVPETMIQTLYARAKEPKTQNAKIKDEIAEPDHWTDKSKTRAVVDNLIRDILLIELPECYDECLSGAFRMQIYEYVYTRYSEVV